MLGLSPHVYIFGHHFAHAIVLPWRLPHPYWTPSRRRNLLNGTNVRSKGTNLTTTTPLNYPRRPTPKRMPPTPPVIKKSGSSTAPLGKRAAKWAAAAAAASQKASAQAASTTRPKTGNASAAPPVAKPSPSSPSKVKSGQGSKHQPKPPSTSPGQATLSVPSSLSPPYRLCYLHYARTCAFHCTCEI